MYMYMYMYTLYKPVWVLLREEGFVVSVSMHWTHNDPYLKPIICNNRYNTNNNNKE